MKKTLLLLLSFLFITIAFQSLAQDDNSEEEDDLPIRALTPIPKTYYLMNARMSCTVPLPTANRSFRKSFVGIYDIGGGLNFYFHKGAFLGAVYHYSVLKITENKIPNYNASMIVNNVGIKVGGDFFVGDNNLLIFATTLTIGKNWTNYPDLKYKDATKPPINTNYSTTYVEPQLSLFFLIDPNFGMGITCSYVMYNHNFDPYELRLNDYSSFDSNNSKNIQYLNFGFEFYYNLFKKKKG